MGCRESMWRMQSCELPWMWCEKPHLCYSGKNYTQNKVRLVDYDDFTGLISPCVYMALLYFFFFFSWIISG